jgi:hypothetical protein
MYPTLAFDYSVPCLFGFLPSVVRWASERAAVSVLPMVTVVVFAGFVLAASLFSLVDGWFRSANLTLILVYVGGGGRVHESPRGERRTLAGDGRLRFNAVGIGWRRVGHQDGDLGRREGGEPGRQPVARSGALRWREPESWPEFSDTTGSPRIATPWPRLLP